MLLRKKKKKNNKEFVDNAVIYIVNKFDSNLIGY
jgi:hypothetical protein